jgi:hypothetical protein
LRSNTYAFGNNAPAPQVRGLASDYEPRATVAVTNQLSGLERDYSPNVRQQPPL